MNIIMQRMTTDQEEEENIFKKLIKHSKYDIYCVLLCKRSKFRKDPLIAFNCVSRLGS